VTDRAQQYADAQSHVRAIARVGLDDPKLASLVDMMDATLQFLKRLAETGVDSHDREGVLVLLGEIPEPARSQCREMCERVWAEQES